MYIKKMSVAKLGCDPKIARDSQYAPGATVKDAQGNTVPSPLAGKMVPLCRIWGRASDTKSGENRSGNSEIWTALVGEFEGVCIQEGDGFPTDKLFESGMVFLPGGIQELIEGAVINAKAASNDNATVEFAVEILSAYDDKSPVGYRYYGKNLRPPAATDNLASLRQLVQPGVKLHLGPAPVQAPKQLPEPVEIPKQESDEAKEPVKSKKKSA